jgi:hypothetical protein
MRVPKFEELLTVLQAMEEQAFQNLVTEDESWFYLDYYPATQWSVCGDNVEPTAKWTIAVLNFMMTVIFGIDGFHVVDVMPDERSFDSEYFLEQVMQPITDKFYPEGEIPMIFHSMFTWTSAGFTTGNGQMVFSTTRGLCAYRNQFTVPT